MSNIHTYKNINILKGSSCSQLLYSSSSWSNVKLLKRQKITTKVVHATCVLYTKSSEAMLPFH